METSDTGETFLTKHIRRPKTIPGGGDFRKGETLHHDNGIDMKRVFSCVFPHPTAHTMFDADTEHYFNRLSYLMLGQWGYADYSS